jgi:predicted nucleic acid-binding Zn ribbon protein
MTALQPLSEAWAPDTLLSEIQRWWPEVVGSGIAAEATPTSERGGILTINCSGAVWAHELDLMGPTILDHLNARLQRGHVTRLRCLATP